MQKLLTFILFLSFIAIGCQSKSKSETAVNQDSVEDLKEAVEKPKEKEIIEIDLKDSIKIKDPLSHIEKRPSQDDNKDPKTDEVLITQETGTPKKSTQTAPTGSIKPSDQVPVVDKKETRPDKPLQIRTLKKAEIKFDEISFDFGEIKEGDIIKHNFEFTNTGNQDLKIISATATCGCTTPSIPFLDIKPGEKGFIGVTYNSVNKEGIQTPEINILTNAVPKTRQIRLVGKVLPKEPRLDMGTSDARGQGGE